MSGDSSRFVEASNTSISRMSVDEARSVMWLRNNHRPLGELLDEGFLNERRLSWAAEKAYDPRLKEAARVLLDWLQEQEANGNRADEASSTLGDGSLPAIEVEITVEEARATHWPFSLYKGRPMGELVDTQTLSLKDLGYAIENAWDKRVRQSAAVLTALRLNQAVDEPTSPAGVLRVVSAGRSYAERRQFSLTMLQGLILGGVLGALLTIFVRGLIRWIATPSARPSLARLLSSPSYAVAAGIAVALAVGSMWLANALPKMAVEKLDQKIDNTYRKGQEGENQVVEVMRRNLDGQWTLFRNLTLPGRNPADIDAVLVGPSGVWTLEIKSYAGEYRNYGEH